jgi:polysaccharide biosynthesis protein PslG
VRRQLMVGVVSAATIALLLASCGGRNVGDGGSGQSSTTSTPAIAISDAIKETFFGISVTALRQGLPWPVPASAPFPTAGKAVSGSYWAQVEPSKGTFDWEPIDNWLTAGKAARVTTFMYTFFETPEWASSNPSQPCSATQGHNILGCAAPPASMSDWEDFVTAVVSRYKGQIQYFELWNEPNVPTEFSGTVSQMVTMAQSAYRIIKSIDPAATVVAPSPSFGGVLSSDPNCANVSTCWLAAYFAAGGGEYADAVGFHGKACTSDVSLCSANNVACPADQLQECAGMPLINQIAGVRTVIAASSLPSKPIINTEGGWATNTALNSVPKATADQQASYFSRFFIVQASEDVQVAVLFDWCGCSLWTGLGPASAEPEILQAYAQTYKWLVGSTMGGPCTEDASSVWACHLTLPTGKQALIIWSDSASSYTPAGRYTSYQKLDDTTLTVSGAVPISILPELLQ